MHVVLPCQCGSLHMGITAENTAGRYGITCQMQDEPAFEAQQRAARALADGRCASQIVPVELKTRSGTAMFDTDENVRGGITVEKLAGIDRKSTRLNSSH